MSITITPLADGGPEVNMANGNAKKVFGLLGITYDGDWGEMAAEDFLGRVLLAQAFAHVAWDDGGRAPIADGRWIEGGRRPGYIAEKLTILHEIATWALERHVDVGWS